MRYLVSNIANAMRYCFVMHASILRDLAGFKGIKSKTASSPQIHIFNPFHPFQTQINTMLEIAQSLISSIKIEMSYFIKFQSRNPNVFSNKFK